MFLVSNVVAVEAVLQMAPLQVPQTCVTFNQHVGPETISCYLAVLFSENSERQCRVDLEMIDCTTKRDGHARLSSALRAHTWYSEMETSVTRSQADCSVVVCLVKRRVPHLPGS